jgi:hypothetical protein
VKQAHLDQPVSIDLVCKLPERIADVRGAENMLRDGLRAGAEELKTAAKRMVIKMRIFLKVLRR